MSKLPSPYRTDELGRRAMVVLGLEVGQTGNHHERDDGAAPARDHRDRAGERVLGLEEQHDGDGEDPRDEV